MNKVLDGALESFYGRLAMSPKPVSACLEKQGLWAQKEVQMSIETSVAERTPEALALSKLEAARMLGVSVRTVDRLIALKQLPVRRLGRRVLVPRNSLQSLLRTDHPTKAA